MKSYDFMRILCGLDKKNSMTRQLRIETHHSALVDHEVREIGPAEAAECYDVALFDHPAIAITKDHFLTIIDGDAAQRIIGVNIEPPVFFNRIIYGLTDQADHVAVAV